MIVFSIEKFKIGEVAPGVVENTGKLIYKGPACILREATEQEFIDYTINTFGKSPRRLNNNKCYYYEISVD